MPHCGPGQKKKKNMKGWSNKDSVFKGVK
jgi:hypothetical protein